MGGIYDLTRFWGTGSDDMVLRCSPLAYLQENGIANKLALTKAEENCLILCAVRVPTRAMHWMTHRHC